jgi:hypothetical protein
MTQPLSAQHFADPAAASAFAAYRQAQAEEYGQYVATAPITYGGVVIFAANQPVPASTVAAHEWLVPLVTRTAPPVQPGEDRGEQLRTRAQQIAGELAAINRELSDAAAAEQEAAAATPYDDLSADELRAALSERGLATSGAKAVLRARLAEDDVAGQAEPAIPVDDTDDDIHEE